MTTHCSTTSSFYFARLFAVGFIVNAVAIWPVTGQGFQNTMMTGSPIFSINLANRKNPSNLKYHMSIKKSQAILKHFIDLKFIVWFTLCSENETMFRDT